MKPDPFFPQPVLLTFEFESGDSDTVMLDASISETHSNSAQISDHQVERGPNVTDNIRILPKRLNIEAMVTNTPVAVPVDMTQLGSSYDYKTIIDMGAAGGGEFLAGRTYKALAFTDAVDRVGQVYAVLLNAQQNGAIFTITTSLVDYQNMAMAGMSVPRSADLGNVLRFTMDFQEMRFVSSLIVPALDSSLPPKASRPKNDGAKPPAEVKQQEDIDSLTNFGDFLKSHTGININAPK